jgi:hypothetical protein
MSEVILLTITDGTNVFQVDRNEAIQLELKLNTSIYGKAWITIGDHLFNFGTNRVCDLKLTLDVFQYAFLYDLFSG